MYQLEGDDLSELVGCIRHTPEWQGQGFYHIGPLEILSVVEVDVMLGVGESTSLKVLYVCGRDHRRGV